MTNYVRKVAVLILLSPFTFFTEIEAFQSFFKFPSFQQPVIATPSRTKNLNEAKLLQAISNTANGKNASKAQQKQILNIVRQLETQNPPDYDILTNKQKSKLLVDGIWYLQYTSPSEIIDDIHDKGAEGNEKEDKDNETWKWKPTVNEDPKIETKQFQAQGTVSAVGIKVDVSNKVPKQIFDVEKGLFFNEVELDFGLVRVGGPFLVSENVPNRVIACFKEGSITFKAGFTIDLAPIFGLINLLRRTDQGGWLETTFISEDVRIGRGNKGSMFVLTRNKDDVSP